MARKTPRHIVIDGEPMVALTPQDFENLAAMRRQLGGQSVRMRSLREALLEAADFLEALDAALRTHGDAGGGDGKHGKEHGAAGPELGPAERELPEEHTPESLLASLPEQIRRARRTAGHAKQRPAR